jgi:hypothetical protein
MSDAHTDADVVKVTRTTTTYEPVATKRGPSPSRRRNSTLLWAIGVCAVVVVAVAGVAHYEDQNTPASAQQSAVAADQNHAQALGQQAATAQQTAQSDQQSADQSEAQARSLAVGAAQDRAAASSAAAQDGLASAK